MEGFNVEKVSEIRKYSGNGKSRKKFRKIVAVFSTAAALIISGCAEHPLGGDPVMFPYIDIYVSISPSGDAKNLYESAQGLTNSIYAIGKFPGITFSQSSTIIDGTNTNTCVPLTKYNQYYTFYALNDLTSPATISFVFVNGTPGYGGSLSNIEQQFLPGGTNYTEIIARNLTIQPNQNEYFYLTNECISNVGGTNMGSIVHWKNVSSTK